MQAFFLYLCLVEHSAFAKIEYILTDILGESRRGFSDDLQAQFNCPCCADNNGGVPDGKYNLEVNLLKQVYMCWKCADTDGTSGSLLKLVRQYGTPAQYQEYKAEVYAIKESKLYDINLYSGDTFNTEEEYGVIYPKTFHKINLSTLRDKRLLEFLKERRIDQETIDRFNIGYTTWDESSYSMRNRLIIPSYDEYGDLNYWVGRDFTGKQYAKYKNCEGDKKKIIYQEKLVNFDADIYLVEGVLDAIRVPNTISMLGKYLTTDTKLYETLCNRARGNIFVVLDGDTNESEIKRIYKRLDENLKLKGRVWYVPMQDSSYKDFSEAYEQGGRRAVIRLIRSARQFSEFELLNQTK